MRRAALLTALLLPPLVPGLAAAEVELQFYLGAQGAAGGDVELDEPGGAGALEFDPDWEGRSFDAPPYYGVRATYWRDETLGFGAEINHAKVYASDDVVDDLGFEQFEFTDGLNFLTVHVARRFPGALGSGRITPYVGAGAGVVLPWVEVDTSRGAGSTDELQFGGPALVAFAGLSYAINDRLSAFAELKGTYSWVEADLDGGGSVEADIATGAVAVGLSVRF